MPKYTQTPATTFENIQLNAGILVDEFDPATGEIGNILGATSGGTDVSCVPTFQDFGEDIDNCPKNMKELKKIDEWEARMSGSFVSVTKGTAKTLVGAADVEGNKITPRQDLEDADFDDLWWVGDYSDKNTGAHAGFIAVHLLNGLNTGGFHLKSNDRGKGTFDFDFAGHYSMDEQDTVPFELYVQEGTPESGEYKMTVTSAAGSASGDTAITVSESAGASQSYVYQTGYGLRMPAQNSVLAGTAWTAWDGEDEITAATGMDIVVAIIDDESKAVHAGKTKVTAKE